jgi:hypothetical protein
MFQGVQRPHELFFYILSIEKRDFGGLLSDVLSTRMALTSLNLPSWRVKNDFGEVYKAMFEVVGSPYELIFYIRAFKKRICMKLRKKF